jgi:Transglutaminase-like superfamily
MNLIRKFYQLSWPDRQLLLEATLSLAIAALFVGVLPFRVVVRCGSLSGAGSEPCLQTHPTAVKRIRWAIEASARRVPWRAMCFEQGLAAQFMLRRRQIFSVLYYGVAPDVDRGISAHVWVRSGELDVVGCELAYRYAVLATVPSKPGELA